jgi:hypothetical protein
MAYEGGFTSALDSFAQRQNTDARTELLKQQAAEQAQYFAQQQQDREFDKKARQAAADAFPDLTALLSPPADKPPAPPTFPQQPPPQPPMPGAPSQPMLSPPPSMAGQFMTRPPPGGPPAPPPAAAPPAAPMPQGAGPGAPLQPPPQARQAPPGGPAGAPGGGQAPGAPVAPWKALPAPLGGPSAGAAGLTPPPAPPNAAEPDTITAKQVNVADLMRILSKRGVTGELALAAVEKLTPVLDSDNKRQLAVLQTQIKAQKAAIDAYKATIAADQRGQQIRQADQRLQQGQERNNLMRQRIQKADAEGRQEDLDADDRKSIGAQAATGEPLTQVVPGWGKGAVAVRNQARKDAIKLIMKDEGVSAEDAGRELAQRTVDFGAGKTAIGQITKDLAAIRPYKDMLDKNADILVGLAEKIDKSDSTLVNRPINWLAMNVASDPNVGEFMAQMRIFQTEAARVLNNPRLVGQLTDSARHELEEVVNGNMPLGMTKQIVNRLKSDGDNRVNAMEKERRQLRGDLVRGGGGSSGGDTPREFKTENEIKSANPPSGEYVVNGKRARWTQE